MGFKPRKTPQAFSHNCAIRQYTGDGVAVGRCLYYLGESPPPTCPVHGDVTEVMKHYLKTGKLTNDYDHAK